MTSFIYNEVDFVENTNNWEGDEGHLSKFDNLLRNGWDKALDDGHFRYKLEIEDTKVFGEKKYIAQLNVKRATHRRKPDEINTLNQPFNPASFNFTKIQPQEILFELEKADEAQNSEENKIQNGHATPSKKVRNLVIINVSPLEYGHVLLVPDIDACRPQVLTKEAVTLSLETMLLSKHRGFRLGFNSLCAFASVNHQHLHAYYLDQELFVESAPVQHVCGSLFEMTSMPAKAFAFQLSGTSVERLSRLIFSITDYFQQNEVAHNLYMVRGPVFNKERTSPDRTIRVYLWPRKKFIGSMWLKDEAAFNVALVELAGHLPIKIKEMFNDLDEKKIEDTILEAALEEQEYAKIKEDVIKICKQADSL